MYWRLCEKRWLEDPVVNNREGEGGRFQVPDHCTLIGFRCATDDGGHIGDIKPFQYQNLYKTVAGDELHCLPGGSRIYGGRC